MDRRTLVIAVVVLLIVAGVVYSCGRKTGPAEGAAPAAAAPLTRAA